MRDKHLLVTYDLIGLMRRAPRTRAELQELTGMAEMTVYRHVDLMLAEGLIERIENRGKSWQYRWIEITAPTAAQQTGT